MRICYICVQEINNIKTSRCIGNRYEIMVSLNLNTVADPVECMSAALDKLRKGDMEYARDVINALFEESSLQTKYQTLLQPEDKQWILALDSLKANSIVLVGMYRNKLRFYDEQFTDEDTGEEVTVERIEYIDDSVWFEGSKEEARALYGKIYNAEISDADLRMVFDCVQYTPFSEMAIIEKKKKQLEDQILRKDLLTCPVYGWICSEIGDAYYFGKEKCGYYQDIDKAREYYAQAVEIKEITGDETILPIGNPLDDFDEKDWDDYDDMPYTCHYRLSGSEALISKVKTVIDKLTEKYGMSDNEFGRYVPTSILLQALLGVKSKSPDYRGNLLFMKEHPDGTLTITVEVNQGYVWPYVFEQGFPGIEVESED